MTATLAFAGNLTWPPKYGVGSTGPWCTFGMATDDGTRYEVSAFAAAAAGLQRAGIGAGDRVRVTARRAPQVRTWTAHGEHRSGLELVATAVERLDPLPAGAARERIVQRILCCSPDDVLGI